MPIRSSFCEDLGVATDQADESAGARVKRALSVSEGHLEDDVLELYSLGRLQEPELSSAEQHLLLCQACRARLEATDAYVAAMRAALKDLKTVSDDTP
jgi:hypothetical protein